MIDATVRNRPRSEDSVSGVERPPPWEDFGKFHFIASLGGGGTADVFLVLATSAMGFAKLQVLKQLRPNLAEDPEFLMMFLDEAQLAARLNHPNVVQTSEVDQ